MPNVSNPPRIPSSTHRNGKTCSAADYHRPDRMIRDKDDDQTKTENRRAGNRAAARDQVQRGSAKCDRRTKRDHRENAGQCRYRDRMGEARNDIGDPDQRAFAQPYQHQAVYGREHRLHHMAADPLPIRAEQAVAQRAAAVG